MASEWDELVVGSWSYCAGHTIQWHRHDTGQLLFLESGAARVVTPIARCVLPPPLAMWIPPRIDHLIETPAGMLLCCAYIGERACSELPREVSIFAAPPPLRELIAGGRASCCNGAEHHLFAMLRTSYASHPPLPLTIPWPRDNRLKRMANEIDRDPTLRRDMEFYAGRAGVTRRTATRLFPKDTGLTFSIWRQRLRCVRALEMLTGGWSVSDAASNVGYASPSAFVARFHRLLGSPPRAFVDSLERSADWTESAKSESR